MHPVIELKDVTPVIYMNAVVMEELFAGAQDRKTGLLLDNLFRLFKKVDRLIVPDENDWRITGQVIAKLGQKYGFEDKYLSKLTNDVLIATSSKRMGVAIMTENIRDFVRIQEFVKFKLLD